MDILELICTSEMQRGTCSSLAGKKSKSLSLPLDTGKDALCSRFLGDIYVHKGN